jgi:hypothetical protein
MHASATRRLSDLLIRLRHRLAVRCCRSASTLRRVVIAFVDVHRVVRIIVVVCENLLWSSLGARLRGRLWLWRSFGCRFCLQKGIRMEEHTRVCATHSGLLLGRLRLERIRVGTTVRDSVDVEDLLGVAHCRQRAGRRAVESSLSGGGACTRARRRGCGRGAGDT